MNSIRSEAIAIKGIDLSEGDRIITFFVRKAGKLRVIANGARKNRSSLRPLVQPFTYSDLIINRKKDIFRLQGGQVLKTYAVLSTDLDKMASASYAMELIDLMVGEEDVQENAFLLLLSAFETIAAQSFNILLLRAFELKLLAFLGYKPHLNSCIQCGNQHLIKQRKIWFGPEEGGIACDSCADSRLGASQQVIFLINRLLKTPLKDIYTLERDSNLIKELNAIMYRYLIYFTERHPKTLDFLNILQNS